MERILCELELVMLQIAGKDKPSQLKFQHARDFTERMLELSHNHEICNEHERMLAHYLWGLGRSLKEDFSP